MNIIKQKGIGIISVVLILCIIGFIALLAVKLVPPYVENYQIKRAVQNVITENKYRNDLTLGQYSRLFKSKLTSYFIVNNIRKVNASEVKLKRTQDGLYAMVQYDVPVKVIANIDAVIHFDDKIKVNI